MKKILFYTLWCAIFTFSACSLFTLDNYEEPAETLQGVVVDAATGDPVLTDQSSEGIRVRLTELSWTGVETPTPNPDFFCRPDGTFRNTKLFKGTYHIQIDGPFIPLIREDDRGVPLADESQTMEISGVTDVRFEVQPFLKVEWAGEPTVSNGKITAQVRVTRAVSEADFRAKIEPMGGYSSAFLNVTDIQLFVSYSSSVGLRARDERWSNEIKYAGSAFNSLLGETITIQSSGTIPSGRTVFIRAAARINYDTPAGSGTKRYNYNTPLEMIIP
ncbi:MAG: DUF3823 domain-containing protein [Prevotellaceae bacterium]|jgi:hypothetical protein|nr:DUF3823 domain-containing protein [Prevotellaceae bacterium]